MQTKAQITCSTTPDTMHSNPTDQNAQDTTVDWNTEGTEHGSDSRGEWRWNLRNENQIIPPSDGGGDGGYNL